VMSFAAVVGLPLPLLPLHLLWINLVTDGLPALALVTDPPQSEVMSRPPLDPAAPILGRPEWARIVAAGALEASVVVVAFLLVLDRGTLEEARSVAFSTIVVSQLLRSFAARSATRIFWAVGAFTNLWLLGVVVLSVALQVGLFAFPATRDVFSLSTMGGWGVGLALALGFVPVSVLEIAKLVRGGGATRGLPG
jgi:Ca2+-transporting ATPase